MQKRDRHKNVKLSPSRNSSLGSARRPSPTILSMMIEEVHTILDYCNSVLCGAPTLSIQKLQQVENSLACIVLQQPRTSRACSLLKSLHWLPVSQRIYILKLEASVCATVCRYFLAPCDKHQHTGHAQQEAASHASTDSACRHPV